MTTQMQIFFVKTRLPYSTCIFSVHPLGLSATKIECGKKNSPYHSAFTTLSSQFSGGNHVCLIHMFSVEYTFGSWIKLLWEKQWVSCPYRKCWTLDDMLQNILWLLRLFPVPFNSLLISEEDVLSTMLQNKFYVLFFIVEREDNIILHS